MLALEGLVRCTTLPRSRPLADAVSRLRMEVRSLDAGSTDGLPSAEAWAANSAELRRDILERDPSGFLRWDVIRRTMFVGSGSFVRAELAALRRDGDWRTRWRDAIREDRFGDPPTLPRYRATSGNRVHHAHHILQFERASGVRMDQIDGVFEFGGGYGGMAHLLRRLGFRGTHVIVDLPMFSALQRFYLSTVLDGRMEGVHCIQDPGEVPRLLQGCRRKLMLATWSFSEVPGPARMAATPAARTCDHFLLGFQERFEELDNTSLPEAMARLAPPGIRWKAWEIPRLAGNRYLMGWPDRA